MSFMVLEAGVAIFTLLMVLEMHRQRRPWGAVLVSALTVFATLTAMIAMWRGL